MKYVAILLVFLSGCSVVPRYHQRGFHVSWFSDGRSLGSSLGAIYMLARFGWLDDLISAWKP
ncbi:MAG: hypothetical protein ORO02_06175 [Bacteroidia bacterium]|nr:hypothetical protein [Bacteroidia bacterium]